MYVISKTGPCFMQSFLGEEELNPNLSEGHRRRSEVSTGSITERFHRPTNTQGLKSQRRSEVAMKLKEFASMIPQDVGSMNWEGKELEVAGTLLVMAEGLQVSFKENGVTKKRQRESDGLTSRQKKKLIIVFPPRKPQSSSDASTYNACFPFVMSFLSAIRVALITPTENAVTLALRDEALEAETTAISPEQVKLPSLTFDEIMQHVRSNPGDDRVLETAVRLQDLVRGVLRILLSTLPPRELTWWNPLVKYDKKTKLWSWVGPVPSHWPQPDAIPTPTSAWGMRASSLNWLVDSFDKWLTAKIGVLQQIACLPPAPQSSMPHSSADERYTEMRNLKNSIITLEPSSEAVRAHFHMEEALRYSIPDQAFSYTTRDGLRSGVPPLKKCFRKPSKRARENFVLNPVRPPHLTVLSLVRDAAARLPHRSGTRSDICTLIRDSQFVMEDATDDDIKQVVVGALDRLHYERDPCIRFDREERLWYYLHGDKEEEDFEENCTASSKRSK